MQYSLSHFCLLTGQICSISHAVFISLCGTECPLCYKLYLCSLLTELLLSFFLLLPRLVYSTTYFQISLLDVKTLHHHPPFQGFQFFTYVRKIHVVYFLFFFFFCSFQFCSDFLSIFLAENFEPFC
jgi:hypothetical protein